MIIKAFVQSKAWKNIQNKNLLSKPYPCQSCPCQPQTFGSKLATCPVQQSCYHPNHSYSTHSLCYYLRHYLSSCHTLWRLAVPSFSGWYWVIENYSALGQLCGLWLICCSRELLRNFGWIVRCRSCWLLNQAGCFCNLYLV